MRVYTAAKYLINYPKRIFGDRRVVNITLTHSQPSIAKLNTSRDCLITKFHNFRPAAGDSTAAAGTLQLHAIPTGDAQRNLPVHPLPEQHAETARGQEGRHHEGPGEGVCRVNNV